MARGDLLGDPGILVLLRESRIGDLGRDDPISLDLREIADAPEEAERQLGAYRDLPACGTPEQIVERLTALRDAGMDYGIFYFPELAHDRSGLELFEREVLPALA